MKQIKSSILIIKSKEFKSIVNKKQKFLFTLDNKGFEIGTTIQLRELKDIQGNYVIADTHDVKVTYIYYTKKFIEDENSLLVEYIILGIE